MKLLLANYLFPASLFPPREPSQFARNWHHHGSNGKGNHVETPLAKPPPVVLWKVSQIAFVQPRSWPWALAEHGVARIAADDVGDAFAKPLVVSKCRRETAIENFRVRRHILDGDAQQARDLGVPARRHELDANAEDFGQQEHSCRRQGCWRFGVRTSL